jgi:hypothetical protein
MSRWTTALPLIVGLATLAACSPRAEPEADGAGGADDAITEHASTAFLLDVRSSVADLGVKVDDLDARFAEASDEAKAQWTVSRAEIAGTRQELEQALALAGGGSSEQMDAMRSDIGDDLGNLTERIEQERLAALDSTEFVAAAQTRLDELDVDIQALGASTARMEAGARRDTYQATRTQLRAESDELRTAVTSFARRAEIEARTDITDRIASLSADVRRQWLEQRHGAAGTGVE